MNMADRGFTAAVYNRTTLVVDSFVKGPAQGASVIGTYSIEDLVATLKRPRCVMMLVKAGQPVDDFICHSHELGSRRLRCDCMFGTEA